jgi:hypothetical protein
VGAGDRIRRSSRRACPRPSACSCPPYLAPICTSSEIRRWSCPQRRRAPPAIPRRLSTLKRIPSELLDPYSPLPRSIAHHAAGNGVPPRRSGHRRGALIAGRPRAARRRASAQRGLPRARRPRVCPAPPPRPARHELWAGEGDERGDARWSCT